MNRLLREDDVIKAVDKNTTDEFLDNDITCILEEIPSQKSAEESFGEICVKCNKCGRFNQLKETDQKAK